MSLNGLIRRLIRSAPDASLKPSANKVITWIEKIGIDYILRGRLEDGSDVDIGSAGGVTQKWQDLGEGIAPVSNKEVSIGLPGNGKELTVGEGDSYNGDGQLIVKTFNGSSYLDVTSNIQTDTHDDFLEFPNINDGTIIYMTSNITDGNDFLKHGGIKAVIVQNAILGAGDIVFEFYNGSSWIEFNHSVTTSLRPFIHLANDKFETTGVHQIRYDAFIDNNSNQTKINIDGDERFWVRWRIVGGITRSMEIDFLKIHSNRTELNPDGFIEYFGSSRPIRKLPITFGSFQAANNSPANLDVYVGDNIGVGRIENSFVNGAIDRSGLVQMIPQDFDTSTTAEIHFKFSGTSSTVGDVRFVIRWTWTTTNGDVFTSTAAAPGTAVGEKSTVGIFSFGANEQDEMKTVEVLIDFPSTLLKSSGGAPDDLWISFERTGNDVADTYLGNVTMIDVGILYVAWASGGHGDNL